MFILDKLSWFALKTGLSQEIHLIKPSGSLILLAIIDDNGSFFFNKEKDSVRAVELIHREAEQTGKPTYHSYSSIPIEQASGPRAAQSEVVRKDRMTGNRRGMLGK